MMVVYDHNKEDFSYSVILLIWNLFIYTTHNIDIFAGTNVFWSRNIWIFQCFICWITMQVGSAFQCFICIVGQSTQCLEATKEGIPRRSQWGRKDGTVPIFIDQDQGLWFLPCLCPRDCYQLSFDLCIELEIWQAHFTNDTFWNDRKSSDLGTLNVTFENEISIVRQLQWKMQQQNNQSVCILANCR